MDLEKREIDREDEMIPALLFTWLQGADFYYDLHRQAVELLPTGAGKTWIDVGSGPGLVARLAAQRGYQVTGVDADPQMIKAAQRIGKQQRLTIDFKTGDVFDLPAASADVVSAASLLAVIDDKQKGLNALWRTVRPGGSLLIIEPTDQLTSENANAVMQQEQLHKRAIGLRMWAAARQGRTVDPGIYDTLEAESMNYVPLLHGLVGAWVIQKKETLRMESLAHIVHETNAAG